MKEQLVHHNLFITLLLGSITKTKLNNRVLSKQKCIDYIEKMAIYGHFSI